MSQRRARAAGVSPPLITTIFPFLISELWAADGRAQIPSAVNFGDDRGEVGHIGNKVWPAGTTSASDTWLIHFIIFIIILIVIVLALRLSQLLVDEPHWVLGKRALLLGAGLGLEGLAAARVGAAHVMLTDIGRCVRCAAPASLCCGVIAADAHAQCNAVARGQRSRQRSVAYLQVAT
jgi:hypothetical protein